MCAQPLRSYPKTNALGSAKSDCHTCLRLHEYCDRQRPHCGPCIMRGRTCGGFVLDIVWQNDRQGGRRFSKAADVGVASKELGLTPALFSQPPLRYVHNGAKRRRKSSKLPPAMDQYMATMSATSSSPKKTCSLHGLDQESLLDGQREVPAVEVPSQVMMNSTWSGADGTATSSHSSSPPERIGPLTSDYHTRETPAWDDSIFQLEDDAFDSAVTLYAPNPPSEEYFLSHAVLSSPGPLYSSAADKAAAILDMYDKEFCILPLTTDCRSNPFRVRQDSCEGSGFLLHAILAISSQHLAKQKNSLILAAAMQNHQAIALRLFTEALSYTPASTLLDTLLLLVNFEATQTASSSWTVHLRGAQRLLESMGGVDVCRQGPRARAQIAMLVWWDVTIAIISRTQPLFGLDYLDALMEYDDREDWTFFELNGCPGELVKSMAQLAKLASTCEKVLTMEWATFSSFPVERIMDHVQKWTNDKDATVDSITETEDDPQCRRNGYHCIEAWRHAILLYARRVFYRPQTQAGLRSISHLARVVLDHVRCIPETAIVQKQALLPVFLAASEVGDEPTRSFVRQYCAHWSSTARYSMFGTVSTLLERIWSQRDESDQQNYWWGVTIGNHNRNFARTDDDLMSDLLLG